VIQVLRFTQQENFFSFHRLKIKLNVRHSQAASFNRIPGLTVALSRNVTGRGDDAELEIFAFCVEAVF
jgi:hypothetical protein